MNKENRTFYLRFRLSAAMICVTTIAMVSVVVLGMSAAFLFGHYSATEYIKKGEASHQLIFKSGENLRVRVIRAGERGILFVDSSSKLLLFRAWIDVEAISRQVP